MGLILRNIYNSFKGYRRIYIILIISQLVSVILLMLAYGVFGSFNLSQQEYTINQRSLYAQFNKHQTTEQIKPTLMKMLEEFDGRMNYFVIFGTKDEESGMQLSVYDEYENGQFSYSKYISKNIPLINGRYPTKYEYNSGAKLVVTTDKYKIGSTIEVLGTEYEIIGNVVSNGANDNRVYVSFNALPSEYKFQWINIVFKSFPTVEDYVFFRLEFESVFGNEVWVEDFEPIDNEEIISMKTMMIICVIIGSISALDTALLYKYIMDKRKKQMAIMGIVGAKRVHRIFINEGEIFVVTLVTTFLGFIIFKFVFEGLVHKVYENIYNIYAPKVYLIMIGLYVAIVMIITLILTIAMSGNKFLRLHKCDRN